MESFKKSLIPILLTGIWISVSETIRWVFLVEQYWLDKYEELGIIMPNEPINMIAWMIWGFLFAITIFILSQKFNLTQTAFLSWFVAFVMMWVIVWNVGILPSGMLWFNIPLSLLEAFVGTLICKRFS